MNRIESSSGYQGEKVSVQGQINEHSLLRPEKQEAAIRLKRRDAMNLLAESPEVVALYANSPLTYKHIASLYLPEVFEQNPERATSIVGSAIGIRISSEDRKVIAREKRNNSEELFNRMLIFLRSGGIPNGSHITFLEDFFRLRRDPGGELSEKGGSVHLHVSFFRKNRKTGLMITKGDDGKLYIEPHGGDKPLIDYPRLGKKKKEELYNKAQAEIGNLQQENVIIRKPSMGKAQVMISPEDK